MNEPYREWWMYSDSLTELVQSINKAIYFSIEHNYPLLQVLPKTLSLLDSLIPYIKSLEQQYNWTSDK